MSQYGHYYMYVYFPCICLICHLAYKHINTKSYIIVWICGFVISTPCQIFLTCSYAQFTTDSSVSRSVQENAQCIALWTCITGTAWLLTLKTQIPTIYVCSIFTHCWGVMSIYRPTIRLLTIQNVLILTSYYSY